MQKNAVIIMGSALANARQVAEPSLWPNCVAYSAMPQLIRFTHIFGQLIQLQLFRRGPSPQQGADQSPF